MLIKSNSKISGVGAGPTYVPTNNDAHGHAKARGKCKLPQICAAIEES